MPRLPRFALLSSLLCCACVRVPRQHDHELAADASLDAEIAFDAGPRMPEAGPPYRGPECDPTTTAGSNANASTADPNAPNAGPDSDGGHMGAGEGHGATAAGGTGGSGASAGS